MSATNTLLSTLEAGITGSQTVSDLKDQATTGVTYAAVWGVVVAIELFIVILLLAKLVKRRGG